MVTSGVNEVNQSTGVLSDDADVLGALDERFQIFVSRLPEDRPIWFCFFSSGLLHVIQHFLRFVPDDLNCAFITSGLTREEGELWGELTSLPTFGMTESVGSHEIFELLFRNMDRPFGLVDSDCFVIRSEFFAECMADLKPGVAISGPLCYGPIPLAAPPFMAIDPRARIEIERAIGGSVSPAAYAFVPPGPEREIDGAMVRLIEEHHRAALSTVLGMESAHLPFPQGGLMDVLDDGREVRSHERYHHRRVGHEIVRAVFDGLMFYQLMALAAGMRIAHFRTFPGTKVFAPEMVHAGGISYWARLRESELTKAGIRTLPWSAHVDALLLTDFVEGTDAPEPYLQRSRDLDAVLRQSEMELDLPSLRRQLCAKLAETGADVTDPRWRPVLG
ncbi:hypothetical protein [Saccharopolyspora gloriosae]|uniref:hypothetical protein n=1 Tax=Saccharopolyspora gloriosae TaxID=455344 RepID=UPI002867BDF2|nr:hypothetical protein [Saccharopolyspora gloriosae]